MASSRRDRIQRSASVRSAANGGGDNGEAAAPLDANIGGTIHLVGSTALLPLATRAASLFHQQYPAVKVIVEGGGSVTGLNAVTSHKADIGDSDIYADPSLYPDPNLTDHIVCVTAFALIVNPQVTISSLSTQQIISIFTGKITNWQQVGGPNLAIVTVIRPSTSGTRALFRKYVMGGLQETGQPLTSDSSTTVLATVAHRRGAIGYVTTTLINSTVKAIAIDGHNATKQNIQAGTYNFWGYEHMYTLDNGLGAVTAFLDFMQTSTIQHLAVQMGYISVNASQALAKAP
jgi:phosphate transport system substrate-binding protein